MSGDLEGLRYLPYRESAPVRSVASAAQLHSKVGSDNHDRTSGESRQRLARVKDLGIGRRLEAAAADRYQGLDGRAIAERHPHVAVDQAVAQPSDGRASLWHDRRVSISPLLVELFNDSQWDHDPQRGGLPNMYSILGRGP